MSITVALVYLRDSIPLPEGVFRFYTGICKVADRVVPLIDACSDVGRLHEWGLQASRLSGADFLKLVTEEGRSDSRWSGRGRTPRPSGKAKPKGSR